MRMLIAVLKAPLVLAARIRGRALDLEFGSRRFWLYPDGSLLPSIAGADGAGDPEVDPTPDPEPDPTPDPEPDEDPESDPTPEPAKEPFDEDRALRTIRNQRKAEKELKAERDKIKAERDELLREKETDQERVVREMGEAKAEAERERAKARKVTIDLALRDAAAEEGVPAKKVKRLLRVVDRESIEVDENGEVQGAEEAVAELLEEFPEFKEAPVPAPAEEEEAPKRTPGANPDRKRKPKEMSTEEARRLARDEPQRFNELFEENRIPKSALKGS